MKRSSLTENNFEVTHVVIDSTYMRKIQEFDFAKEEKEKVKNIYTIFNYDG